MNERIKELMKQAGTDSSGKWMGLEHAEKFAQLIVQECARLCEHESNDDEHDQYDMGMSVKAKNIKTAIKQHFGVEPDVNENLRNRSTYFGNNP